MNLEFCIISAALPDKVLDIVAIVSEASRSFLKYWLPVTRWHKSC
jgi:hypothetical protein